MRPCADPTMCRFHSGPQTIWQRSTLSACPGTAKEITLAFARYSPMARVYTRHMANGLRLREQLRPISRHKAIESFGSRSSPESSSRGAPPAMSPQTPRREYGTQTNSRTCTSASAMHKTKSIDEHNKRRASSSIVERHVTPVFTYRPDGRLDFVGSVCLHG